MANIVEFYGEVKREVGKVTWPTRKETTTATIMVLVMAVIAAIFFFMVDKVAGYGIAQILTLGK